MGSNLGDRLVILSEAKTIIEQRLGTITQQSRYYETSPWGVLDQPVFVNQVIALATNLSPEKVLAIILEIETTLGRIRKERWGARTIDIDILYYSNWIVNEPNLVIPHPNMHERMFTLAPLHELIPDFLHPIFLKTTSELMTNCSDTGVVIPIS